MDDQDDQERLSDEYHEDSLPDLVLDTCVNDLYEPSDLLKDLDDGLKLSGYPLPQTVDRVRSISNERLRSSSESKESWNEDEYNSSNQEIVTEVSSTSRGVFKVSFVDHSKAYVAKVSTSDKYRSFLSLMPPDDQTFDEEEEPAKKEQILSDFRALSFEEQKQLRFEWHRDLETTEREMAEIKELLAFKTAWCGVLRRKLGMTKWQRISTSCKDHVAQLTEKTASSWNHALEATETKLLNSQSLQKAKESFEALANEVRERMRQSKEELVRKVTPRFGSRSSNLDQDEEPHGQVDAQVNVKPDTNSNTKPSPVDQSED